MGTALALVCMTLSSGYAVVRLLGLSKGASAVGLIPATGLSVMALLGVWLGLLGSSAPIAGFAVLGFSLLGLALLVVDREWLWTSASGFVQQHRAPAVLLVAAVLVPMISMGIAFAPVQAPLSTHDGAFHVETSEMFRRGAAVGSWYPPGLAALFGAVLQLTPWLDTAAGAFWLGAALSLLAPLTVFGLGVAIWRNLLAASAGALLVSLTHLFVYFPQFWSGWPQLFGILLVLGLWVVAISYVDRPAWQWAVLAGVLLGAIIVVHGTELYTTAIVVIAVTCATWRTLPWRRLGPDIVGAVLLAIVCAAPYLPVLLHWAGAGGAYVVGDEDGTALGQGSAEAVELLKLFSLDALGIDFPIRIALLLAGLVFAFKFRAGRSLLAVTTVFIGLAIVATQLNFIPAVRSVFAATYPWSLPFRHLTFASIGLAMIAGGGTALAAAWWTSLLARVRGVAARRRIVRVTRLLVLAWLGLSCWALITLLSIETAGDTSFVSDDAAAMAWMASAVAPSDIVVNDTFADAGIWAPYKAGASILFYRSFNDPATAEQRELILRNVATLDQNPSAAAAACALDAKYVYYGAANTAWQARAFPPLEEMRASAGLQQVFAEGQAAVFRIEVPCAME